MFLYSLCEKSKISLLHIGIFSFPTLQAVQALVGNRDTLVKHWENLEPGP